ncbi:MAG: hypothetical protein AMJ69_05075 [Gammaproteobacteria bacterium SG8_47]|nr:MAG: hypothetical protein AMJ69_05075 [Gammaproteobacteria bacterium SG8_47]
MTVAAEEILETILAELERDARVNLHDYPISASVNDSTLTLQGEVENIAAKKIAAATARRLYRQGPVTDQLRVSASDPHNEGVLRDEVVTSFIEEPVFTEYSLSLLRGGRTEVLRDGRDDEHGHIDVTIDDGLVSLAGRVGSLTHRRLAEVLMWWTAGCQVVENRLEVVPPEEDNDGELTDAVLMALEKDPLVHASQLSVHARDGVVTLDGYVASAEEQRLAVLDAWTVPDVKDVVDRIQAHG